jgi:hypothetical protein
VPFEEALVALARVSPFLARLLVFLAANLFVLAVALAPLAFRPSAFLGVFRRPRFWLLAAAGFLATSLLGAALLSLFPPGKRLFPFVSVLALGFVVEVWVKRRAEKGRDATAA